MAEENLDAIVSEVVTESLRPEERDYLKEHALKKPLQIRDIWALGVGGVIAGVYFGWNLGLKDNGSVAMLVASLLVCLLYLTWVLALAELSVAMPYAGGPLAYGRRAVDSSLGFVMGWSMFLECQFAAVAAAQAAGSYIAFLISYPEEPDNTVRVIASLATVLVFFLLHCSGVQEQSRALLIMTWAAVIGVLIFWMAAATDFSWSRAWPDPVFPAKGWRAVLEAVPFALWWLVIIETVALAAEEAHEPHRTIPRGLVWAQVTLIALVILTWLFACGAMDAQELAVTEVRDANGELTTVDVDFPLVKVLGVLPHGSKLLLYGFGIIAVFGILASYHAMIYGASRQSFALGRAGYLPGILGQVHAVRRTPVPALAMSSLGTAVCVIVSWWYPNVGTIAVLVSTLTALIWYILAMGCLFLLRSREPELFVKYRTPVYRVLPITVVVLSLFAALMYSIINTQVIPLTALLYALGLGYFWFWAHSRIRRAAPEELTARHAQPEQEGAKS